MDSFYAGRPGYSFVIAKSYASVAEMVERFKKGPEYSDVHFNEYVLINTVDKHDKDNGKIYRRGMDYTNEFGGAQYVGTIVGPSGMAPHVEMSTLKEVDEMPKEEGVRYRFSEGSWSVENDALVPGKTDEGEFNDEIKWNCYSVRTENNDDCTAYIGFQIPYPVIDYSAESVDPYYNRSDAAEHTDNFTNENLVERTDEKDHPFHEHWHISIPKGIHGAGFENLRVIAANDETVTVEEYPNQEDDKEKGRKIWVVDYYHYDKESNGEKVTLYVGDYNVIEDINIDNDGNVTIAYTHDDEKKIELIWLNGLDIQEDGTVVLHYTNQEDTQLDTKVKWLVDVNVDTGEDGEGEGTGTQQVRVKYNTDAAESKGTAIGKPLNYIMKTAVTEDFHLIIKHSDPAKRQQIKEQDLNYKGKDGAGYMGEDDWQDMGAIKDEDGILIGLNLEKESPPEGADFTTKESTIKYLNETYKEGLIGDNLTGKVVTVGYEDKSKLFYAFNYNKKEDGSYKGWYYLGCLQLEIEMILAVAEENEIEKIDALNEKGVWFKVEDNNTLEEAG